MEKYLDKNLHGRGYFRKTKQWGLACGIALAGAIVFGSQSASADEVTAQPSVKEAESAVVANKVDDNSVAKQTTAETNSKAQTVVENKDVKSTTSEEKAATNQEGLNKKYESIKELAKKESVVTKETEKVNHETIDLANKDLAKQEQAVKDAAKQNAELNSQLKKAIDEAKKSNINVTLDKTVTHETVDAAKKDVDEQVAQIEKLVSLVSDAKARISKSLEEASKAGVKFEGETKIVLTPGKESEFEVSVSGAEKTLADLKNKQVTLTNLLNSLSEKAKAGGVEVTKGKTVVLDEKEASELAKKTTEKVEIAISDTKFNKDTYEKALAEWNKAVADAKTKVEADYNKALDEFNKKVAEAKAKNEQIKAENEKLAKDSSNAKSQLTKDSTATKNQDGSYNQILKAVAKAKSVTDTKVSHVPLDTIAVLDYSSSYQSKREEALNQLKALIQNDLTDQDNVMLQAYIYNKENSFVAHGAQLDFSKLSEKDWETGVSTLLLSKKEALEVIDRLLAIKAPNTPGGAANYSDYFNAVAKAFGDKAFKTNETATGGTVKTVPFEEVYTSQPNKNKIVSVIQFTDGWADTEKMDSTFATWAKTNAKTFMSVVNRNKLSETDNNDPNSVKSMTELGHPNIYDTTGKSADVVQKEIITQFKNTATEVSSTTTVTKSEAVVTITPEEGVKLISAELVSPSGKKQALEVKDNKVSFKGALAEDGEYKVNYTFTSTNNKASKIEGSIVVADTNSKDAKADKFEPTKLGEAKELVEVPNNAPKKGEVKTPEKPKTPKALSVEIPEVQLKAKGVKIGEVETKAHEVGVETKIHPVSYTEPKVATKEGKVLPHTGESLSASLLIAGLGVAGLASLVLSKKKQEN